MQLPPEPVIPSGRHMASPQDDKIQTSNINHTWPPVSNILSSATSLILQKPLGYAMLSLVLSPYPMGKTVL